MTLYGIYKQPGKARVLLKTQLGSANLPNMFYYVFLYYINFEPIDINIFNLIIRNWQSWQNSAFTLFYCLLN